MCHDLLVRTRTWAAALAAAVGVVALCGAAVAGWQELSRRDSARERSSSDDAVRAYLNSMTNGDYGAAHALVCTDETGTDRSSFERVERSDPIRTFNIESSTRWSSFVDGHGRTYRVRVTRANGSSLVEIRTQGTTPVCIQYANTMP